jgi:hypothetical protein
MLRVSLLFSQLDYQQVISILAQSITNQDTVVLQFPLRVKTSNYTEVVNSQTEYNAIVNGCTSAESSGPNAISSVKLLSNNFNLQHDVSTNRKFSFIQSGIVCVYEYCEYWVIQCSIRCH